MTLHCHGDVDDKHPIQALLRGSVSLSLSLSLDQLCECERTLDLADGPQTGRLARLFQNQKTRRPLERNSYITGIGLAVGITSS